MKSDPVVKKLVKSLKAAKLSGAFSCSGKIPETTSPLAVNAVGPVQLPITIGTIRKLRELASPAPYGKGTETLVDPKVRKTLEIDPGEIELSASFLAAVERVGDEVSKALGLDRERLEIELYKLLVYEQGGMFLPHRDSEKHPGMVATLIVALPSRFRGGELVISHDGRKQLYAFSQAAAGNAIEYVAFFADCQHEVKRVASGSRVCLAFNLILKPAAKTRGGAKSDADPALVRAIDEWIRGRPADPMVFALEHHYTQGGLTPNLLKGSDRLIYDQLAAAAKTCACRVHLGQVSRHLSQDAYDDDSGYGRYDRYGGRRNRGRGGPTEISELSIGEVIDDSIVVDGWKNVRGKAVAMGPLSCEESMLISTQPVEEWKPTEEDYEGYTGNAGNVLERWYHRSAVVLWSDDHHYDVIATMGMEQAVNELLSMRAALARTPEALLEQACADCQALAEAIIRHWPQRSYVFVGDRSERAEWATRFTQELPTFDDPDLVGAFLKMIAKTDGTLRLTSFLTTACERLGADDVMPYLRDLVIAESSASWHRRSGDDELPDRDADWLVKLCTERERLGIDQNELAELLGLAIDRWERRAKESEFTWHSPSTTAGKAWLVLCQAALRLNAKAETDRLFKMPAKLPKTLDLRGFQAAAAVELRHWATNRLAELPEAVQSWVAAIVTKLEEATRTKPEPPNDLVRDSQTRCNCEHCRLLKQFLADPTALTTNLGSNDSNRQHLSQEISVNKVDVTSILDQSRRPYSLKLTKTMKSYEDARKRYQEDLKLLANLR